MRKKQSMLPKTSRDSTRIFLPVMTIALLLLSLASCGDQHSQLEENTLESMPNASRHSKEVDSTFKYTDSQGGRVIIENSLPKGELYKDANGQEYAKAIFWTRITNDTDSVLAFHISFSGKPILQPSSARSSEPHPFLLMLHPDPMTHEKEGLKNHGLNDIDSFVVNNLHRSTSLTRTVKPDSSTVFYLVRLRPVIASDTSAKPTETGITRAGFRLEGQEIIFTLNGSQMYCGRINLENLKLKK